jgi:hypothetical protein
VTITEPPEQLQRWIEYMPVEDLQVHPTNPKGHALDDLVAAVERFGYTEPILLCERTGWIASGHGRREAVIRRRDAGDPPPDGVMIADDGTWLMPVVRGWASADDAELRAWLVAGNNLPAAGGWVGDHLEPILRELADSPHGLDGTGLDQQSLDQLLAEVTRPDFQPVDPTEQPRLDRKFHLVCNNCGAAVDPAAAERVEQ